MTEIDMSPVFIDAEIKQNRGPMLKFEGRLLAETEWSTRDGQMRLEIWQTRGGALIPVTRSIFNDKRRGITSASVVEPEAASLSPNDLQETAAMRFAVMDHFDWTDAARSMVREQLGWKLTQVVE